MHSRVIAAIQMRFGLNVVVYAITLMSFQTFQELTSTPEMEKPFVRILKKEAKGTKVCDFS